MGSKDIKKIFAEYEGIKAAALTIAEMIGKIPEGFVDPRDVDIENRAVEGLYFSFYGRCYEWNDR